MKRNFVFIVALFVSMVAFAYTETINGVDWHFSVESDESATITAVSGTLAGEISVPSYLTRMEIDSTVVPTITNYYVYVVRRIDDEVFSGCESITKITVPSTVTDLGHMVFAYCTKLGELILPNSVRRIPWQMCSGCSALAEIDIPTSVTNVGMFAFAWCDALETLSFPEGVLTIGECAFDATVSDVSLPDSLVSICAFYSDDLDDSVPDGPIIVDGWLMGYKGACPQELTLPSDVVGISSYAFCRCYDEDAASTNLRKLVLPDNVKTLAPFACAWTGKLKEVEIGKGLKHLGVRAFSGCDLTNVLFRCDKPDLVEPQDFYWDTQYTYDGNPNIYESNPNNLTTRVVKTAKGWNDILEVGIWQGHPITMLDEGETVIEPEGTIAYTPEGWSDTLIIPHVWIVTNGLATIGDETTIVVSKLNECGKNGILRYQSYILGMDPDANVPANEQLKVLIRGFDASGEPLIDYEPKPIEPAHVNVTILGKPTLSDGVGWQPVGEGDANTNNFFKVAVEVK